MTGPDLRGGATARTHQLDADGNAARSARRFLRELCAEVGRDDLEADASIVVTELVTNAVIHAATPSVLRLRHADGVLRIEVADGSVRSPTARTAADGDESGRGLLLVETLTRAWGCDVEGDGKVVWAELAEELGGPLLDHAPVAARPAG